MIPLLHSPPGALRSLLPPGRDLAVWHATLAGEISANLSPAHAAVLAQPSSSAGGTDWSASGVGVVRYSDLPQAGRQALEAALAAILSDLRRLAESGAAPAVREAWPALREVPDLGHLFAVDGRPVLAGWGHASNGASGRLDRFDDGIAWRAAPRAPWGRYAAALGVLGALALASGLLLPFAPGWLTPAPAQCTVAPGQREAMLAQANEESRTAELRTLLASVTEEVGRKQLQCPIPVLPAPPARQQTPAPPPPAPPPRADLPQERWDRRDVTMLEGCWTLTTGIRVGRDPNSLVPVRSWRMCFDGRGAGQQTMVLENGATCEGPLEASFAGGDQLRVTQPRSCTGPRLSLNRSELQCRRLSDSEATCTGTNLHGDTPTSTYTGRFRR